MLATVIINRFIKHHDLCLAYMDALEEIAQNIRISGNSLEQLESHSESLSDFFHFMETVEHQHEKEEEKVLLPVLVSRMNQAESPIPEDVIHERLEEHDLGRAMLADLKERWKELTATRPSEASPYYLFTGQILDLIWHFRRHIWEENALILPTARRLIPDAPDPIWIRAGEPSTESNRQEK